MARVKARPMDRVFLAVRLAHHDLGQRWPQSRVAQIRLLVQSRDTGLVLVEASVSVTAGVWGVREPHGAMCCYYLAAQKGSSASSATTAATTEWPVIEPLRADQENNPQASASRIASILRTYG